MDVMMDTRDTTDGIVDAHVHFWDPALLEYPWLRELPMLDRAFRPPDYDAAIAGAQVNGTVVIEANAAMGDTRGEARWFDRLAQLDERIRGIVAYVAVDSMDRDRTLDELANVARVKGIRHNIQGEPAGFCLRFNFIDGVRTAGRRCFSFDLCATHDQLGEVVELVTQCPETHFVLDHCGKPAIRDAALEPWKTHIRALAERQNVSCKLSGLLTEAAPHCTDRDLMPYAEHVVECFGAARVMYGSDWPVLTLAGDYSRWLEFTRMLTSSWTPDEQRAFYSGNATRFYALQSPHLDSESAVFPPPVARRQSPVANDSD
jgi:L-fuconolactonase